MLLDEWCIHVFINVMLICNNPSFISWLYLYLNLQSNSRCQINEVKVHHLPVLKNTLYFSVVQKYFNNCSNLISCLQVSCLLMCTAPLITPINTIIIITDFEWQKVHIHSFICFLWHHQILFLYYEYFMFLMIPVYLYCSEYFYCCVVMLSVCRDVFLFCPLSLGWTQ